MPGLEKSAPKVARPVTLSSPSGLLVRLPIHLLFEPFAVIAALSSISWVSVSSLLFRLAYSVFRFVCRRSRRPRRSGAQHLHASTANPSPPRTHPTLPPIIHHTALTPTP